MHIENYSRRGTQHWSCLAPVVLAWMDSASTSLGFTIGHRIYADLNIREVDLELVAATAPTQAVEVSIHQSFVEEPAIMTCRAPTMGQSACFQVLLYPSRVRQECRQRCTAPYRAQEHRQRYTTPCRAPERRIAAYYRHSASTAGLQASLLVELVRQCHDLETRELEVE